MTGPFDLFISYSRKDNIGPDGSGTGWVTALRDFIVAEARMPGNVPVRDFLDTDDIDGFADWRHRILGALRQSKVLLVCLSPNYFDSDYCRWEWEHFMGRQGPHGRGDGEPIQSVCFVELPQSDSAQNADWLDSIRRSTTVTLAPWFAQSPALLHTDSEVRAAGQKISDNVSQRVQAARRGLALEYGNLRAATDHFVGRAKQLQELHEAVGVGRVGVITALHGLGGIGKTELAVFYANEYARSFPAGIWWLDVAGQRDLKSAIANLTFAPGFDAASLPANASDELRFDLVLDTLRRRSLAHIEHDPDGDGQVLLLLDNVDHPELLGSNQRTAVSNQSWLSLIATTREAMQSWQQADTLKTITLDGLDPDDALALMREWQPEHAFRDPADEAAARALLDDLDCYTLAVEQAAIYLGTHPELRIDQLLALLRQQGLQALDLVADDPDVAATIKHRDRQLAIVLEQTLPKSGTLARTVLDYAACWGAAAIPLPWVQQLISEHHGELLTGGTRIFPPEDAFANELRWLEHRRLLTPAATSELRRTHRLVRGYLQKDVRPEIRSQIEAQINREQERLESSVTHLAIESWRVHALQSWAMDTDLTTRLRATTLEVLASWTRVTVGASAAIPLARVALGIRESLVRADPRSEQALRELTLSLDLDGAICAAVGDTASALAAYQRSMGIRRALLSEDPSNAQKWRDFLISGTYVGRINTLHGDMVSALSNHESSLATAEAMAIANPGNRLAQRDLSVCLNDVGLIKAQADPDGALAAFLRSVEIRKVLADADHGNMPAKRDVMISASYVGSIKFAKGDINGALESYGDTLNIAESLARVDPISVQAKRDLSLGLASMGRIKAAQSDSAGALALFLRSLGIREELVKADPESAVARRDLSESCDFVGRMKELEDVDGALSAYQRSLEIRQTLVLEDPSSAQAQRDLAVSHIQLWKLSSEQSVVTHHAKEMNRIWTELEARSAHISLADRELWDQIKQWLRDN